MFSKLKDWNEDIARKIAESQGILLTPDHWAVIYFLRRFYEEYQLTPALRILVQELKKQIGEEKGNSLYIQSLFPGGFFIQASKIAGLPKPSRCT